MTVCLPHFPIDIERAAAILEAHPHYRVLRAVPPLDLFPSAEPVGNTRTALILDTETTGLDPAVDRIIELAVLELYFDRRGKVVGLGRARDWLENPDTPLPPEISRLTRLTDADLAGQRIDDAEATAMLGAADLIVAHNAKYDVAFVERRFPAIAGRAWACSMAEIDWPALGYDGRKLGHVVMQSGYFHSGHRADADVHALAWLLANEVEPGRTGLRALIDTACEPTFRVAAIGAPMAVKNLLKARRYRWDPLRRCWVIEVTPEQFDAEIAWLKDVGGCEKPWVQEIDWHKRHR